MGKWIAGVIFAFVLGGACTYAAFTFVPEDHSVGPARSAAADQPPAGAGANLPDPELAPHNAGGHRRLAEPLRANGGSLQPAPQGRTADPGALVGRSE